MDFSISNFTDALKKYVVMPRGSYGVDGFIFDIYGDETVNLTSEITDHTIEDNSQIQDHITLKPKKITLRGYVGEVVYRNTNLFTDTAQKLNKKLSILDVFAPTLASQAQQTITTIANKANMFVDTVKEAVNANAGAWYFIEGSPLFQTKQEQAFQYFSKLWESKVLVSVQTPFEFFNNMAIESVVALQREDSQHISDFSITLKQIKKAQVKIVAYNPSSDPVAVNRNLDNTVKKTLQGRADQQASPVKQIGRMTGQKTSLADDVGAYLPPELAIDAEQLANDKQYDYDANSKGIELP